MHAYIDYFKEKAQKEFNNNRKFIWRRLDQAKRVAAGIITMPQPQQFVRTGLAANNRRTFFNARRPANVGYGAPTYYSANMTGNFYNQPQQWSKKRTDGGASSSQYH